jgi:two-component system, NtrC family, sensor kinase
VGIFAPYHTTFLFVTASPNPRFVSLYKSNVMKSADFKLKERVKELNCLYELSKVAWEADNDLESILSKTLVILPKAMQHQSIAEASITVNQKNYTTQAFSQCKTTIRSIIAIDKVKLGKIEVGYRQRGKQKQNVSFLQEEKNLLNAVAREIALFVKRASAEKEKETLQIQLQHAERLAFVGELSAGIAHELNEPLGSILGFAQLIKKTGSLTDQQTEDIERIVKASLYTREIIKKLMIFSRQMPRQITSVNLNEIIENILYFIDVRFQARATRIVKHLDPKLHHIQADEVQMSQVLVNLLTNAIQAMPKGGDLSITTKNKDKNVRLLVKDTGTGMSKKIQQKIFEPFFTTKIVGQGTGLGLSVVQGIIDSHRGKISVTSSPGRGSTFEIVLPRTQK